LKTMKETLPLRGRPKKCMRKGKSSNWTLFFYEVVKILREHGLKYWFACSSSLTKHKGRRMFIFYSRWKPVKGIDHAGQHAGVSPETMLRRVRMSPKLACVPKICIQLCLEVERSNIYPPGVTRFTYMRCQLGRFMTYRGNLPHRVSGRQSCENLGSTLAFHVPMT
jgi:hypothetical protein